MSGGGRSSAEAEAASYRRGSVGTADDRDELGFIAGRGYRAVGALQAADTDALLRQPCLARSVPDELPRQPGEAGLRGLAPVVERRGLDRVVVAKRARPRLEGALDVVEHISDAPPQPNEWDGGLGVVVPPHEGGVTGGQIARPELDADGHALQLPLDGPTSERGRDSRVDLDACARAAQLLRQRGGAFADTLLVAHDEHH